MGSFTTGVFDRLSWLFSLAGIYISGYLTAAKALNRSLACSSSNTCDLVTNSSRSYLWGVPVAYIGLAGYVLLMILTLGRIFFPRMHRNLLLLAFFASTAGLLTSVFLTYVAVFQIHAVCRWCMASGITMALLWLCTGWSLTLPKPERRSGAKKIASLTFTGLAAIAIVVALQMKASVAQVETQMLAVRKDQIRLSDLIPSGAHILGNTQAPYTIVTFSDLVCPNCKAADLKLFSYFKKPLNANLVFRHRPLEFHAWAYESAVLSEAAAESADFYRFAEDAFNHDFNSLEDLKGFAVAEGVPRTVVQAALREGSKERKIVDRDLALCRKLNIQAVPTIMLVHGKDVRIMSSDDALAAVLKRRD